MSTIRRLYLYAVSFISLETVLWGAIGLLRSIFAGEQIGGSVERLAGALSLLLVGIPVFLLHWLLAQRGARKDPENRSARLRAVFLYGALLATLVAVAQNLLALIARSLVVVLGADPWQAFLGGGQSLTDNLVAVFLNLLMAVYFYMVLRSDWQASPLEEAFTETRRLYHYLWMLYTLAMVVFGAQQLLHSVFNLAGTVGGVGRVLIANGIALLLVGTPVWAFTWTLIQRSLFEPPEARSTLRLGILYALTLAGAITVLSASGMVAYHLLRFLLGEDLSLPRFLSDVGSPLSLALPFGVVWLYYRRALETSIFTWSQPESEATPSDLQTSGLRAAGLRRLYKTVLSLLGLGATFIGLHQLLTFLIDLLVGGQAVFGGALRSSLAAALAALLVGVPVWVLAWRPLVGEAALQGEMGDHARRSILRKGYLYLVLFVAVIGLMFSAGAVLFQLLSALLGDPPADMLAGTLRLVEVMLLFILLLGYHWQTLRADNSLAERSLARLHAQFPVLVLSPDNGDFANSLVYALQREAEELPVAVHPYSQGVPDETLSAARAVILPGELLAKPSEAMRLWLQGFNGARLVVPTPAPGWHWIFGSGRSLAAGARQVARAVRHLAEGEDVPPPREASPWIVLVYIFATLFAAQLLLGLVSLVISLLER